MKVAPSFKTLVLDKLNWNPILKMTNNAPIKVINVFDTGTGTEEEVLEPSLEETKEEVVIVEDIVDNLEKEW